MSKELLDMLRSNKRTELIKHIKGSLVNEDNASELILGLTGVLGEQRTRHQL